MQSQQWTTPSLKHNTWLVSERYHIVRATHSNTGKKNWLLHWQVHERWKKQLHLVCFPFFINKNHSLRIFLKDVFEKVLQKAHKWVSKESFIGLQNWKMSHLSYSWKDVLPFSTMFQDVLPGSRKHVPKHWCFKMKKLNKSYLWLSCTFSTNAAKENIFIFLRFLYFLNNQPTRLELYLVVFSLLKSSKC